MYSIINNIKVYTINFTKGPHGPQGPMGPIGPLYTNIYTNTYTNIYTNTYTNIHTNTYANTHANFIDCKGGGGLLVYSIGMCIGIYIGMYIGIYASSNKAKLF